MALDTNIRGSISGLGVEVNANNQLYVTSETNITANPRNVGAIRFVSENDSGDITGRAYLKSPETTSDYRLRAALDMVLYTDTFNTSIHNTNIWYYTFSTMTATQTGNGLLQLGTVQGTAATHGALLKSYQYFPIIGTAPLSVEITAGIFTSPLVTDEVVYLGLGNSTVAGTVATDGAWFKITSSGISAEIMFGGTSTSASFLYPTSSISLNNLMKFTITLGEGELEFWLDDIFLGEILIPPGNGQPFQQGSLPIILQRLCTNTVSNSATIRISDVTVLATELSYNKLYSHQQAGMGLSCNIVPSGTATNVLAPHSQFVGAITTGSTPLLITGTAGSATAANIVGLGGYGTITAPVAAATDIIASSYQVPAGTFTVTGRNLYITGIYISAVNLGAAVATTPTTLLWGAGYGHTAVSMATLETSSTTFTNATTHAPRRITLGFMSAPIASAIGATYDKNIERTFTTPIVVRPGEFINTYFKVLVGTATTSQVIGYNVEFDGYWE